MKPNCRLEPDVVGFHISAPFSSCLASFLLCCLDSVSSQFYFSLSPPSLSLCPLLAHARTHVLSFSLFICFTLYMAQYLRSPSAYPGSKVNCQSVQPPQVMMSESCLTLRVCEGQFQMRSNQYAACDCCSRCFHTRRLIYFSQQTKKYFFLVHLLYSAINYKLNHYFVYH